MTDFWNWFAANSDRLASTLTNDPDPTIIADLEGALSDIDPNLGWEIGPGQKRDYSFTLTCSGDIALRRSVEEMIRQAPEFEEWEFFGARQPRPLPPTIQLSRGELSFNTSDWQFCPIENTETGGVDIRMVSAEFLGRSPDDCETAALLLLDCVLGEDFVESWVGDLTVSSVSDINVRCHPVEALNDYFEWVQYRDKPLGPRR